MAKNNRFASEQSPSGILLINMYSLYLKSYYVALGEKALNKIAVKRSATRPRIRVQFLLPSPNSNF